MKIKNGNFDCVEVTLVRKSSNKFDLWSNFVATQQSKKVFTLLSLLQNLAFRSLIRNFDCVEVTRVRKCSNKFGFSLTNS